MNDYNKIHQHIQLTLEERGFTKPLSDLFEQHKIISFKFWRLISFITLFPLCIQNAFSSKLIVLNLIGTSSGFSYAFLDFFIFSFGVASFFAPIVFSTFFLTAVLPLSKLSKQTFFKKHFGKYFRKFPIIASSCDTIHYKEDFIIQFSKDIELNLSMSSYYQYLLQFPFDSEIKRHINVKINKLLNIDINQEQYSKDFPSIVLSFINDFEYFSKSPILLKANYNQNLANYSTHIFSDKTMLDMETNSEIENSEEIQKKKFKEML